MKAVSIRWTGSAIAVLCLVLAMACSRAPEVPEVFPTPEAAVDEMVVLIENRDDTRIEQVFGPGSLDLFRSGDEAADQEDIRHIAEMIKVRVTFEGYDENTVIALFGDVEWPWPIPLVRNGDGWSFDTAEGREELLNRRIGRNELWTLTALHEIVEAQREYRSEGRDGNPPAYAQRFLSSEGTQDGLFWPTENGEQPSPLGGLLADSDVGNSAEPKPFHGYYYRMLHGRGPNAPGGERSYLDDNGLMTAGFGVVAWPAKYGNSGIMTFVTNQRGLIFQIDLGENTELLSAAIDSFDPDESWTPESDVLDD